MVSPLSQEKNQRHNLLPIFSLLLRFAQDPVTSYVLLLEELRELSGKHN